MKDEYEPEMVDNRLQPTQVYLRRRF
jgi:hypothetical protein